MAVFTSYVNSPLGLIEVISSKKGIMAVSFSEAKDYSHSVKLPEEHQACHLQLLEYFKGTLKEFKLPLSLEGTTFQQKVWRALMAIPWGSTLSYRALAEKLGDGNALRAVGTANSKNKIAIIIPCHRVIGSNGDLVGYASGLKRKEWLLRHEGALEQLTLFDPIL